MDNTKTLLPMSKPRMKVDFQRKDHLLSESFESGKNLTPQLATSSQSRDKNTEASEVETTEVLRFKHEFDPQLDLSKNAKFSIDEMLKHKKSPNPFQSSQPKDETGITKQQCKLVPIWETKKKINVRNIQKQIMSRSITISNILTNRSMQKSNEISISSLLASDLNTSSHNLQRQPHNIGFLMTSHSIQYPAENLVCEPN